jgi:BMFP domain-containing protein YqiC
MDLKARIEKVAEEAIHPIRTAVDAAIADAKKEFAVAISAAETAGVNAVSALEKRVAALEAELASVGKAASTQTGTETK